MRVRKDATQPVYSERIAVRQVEWPAIELLVQTFGGSIYRMKASARRGKPLYAWQVTDLRALRCLQALRPYLRIKTAQADNALHLRELKERSKREKVAFGRGHQGAARRPEWLTSMMEAAYENAKRLNSVGIGRGVIQ
jgi:hypothetical protein